MGNENQIHGTLENLENFELFYKFLTQTPQGLALCRVLPTERTKIFDFFSRAALKKRIHLINMANPLTDPLQLQQSIVLIWEKYDQKKNIFFIYNFESCIDLLKTTARDFFQKLNLIRDFFMNFNALFVFFMTEESEKNIIHNAFDFYDWITSSFVFRAEDKYLNGKVFAMGGISEITILHLSDIHFKKKKDHKDKRFRLDLQQKLIQAVKVHTDKYEAPGVVVVTGDVAFSGEKHQYDEALTFFEKLNTILPKDTPILVVPGNHDVDRNEVKKFFSLQQNIVHKEVIDKFIRDKKGINDFINVKFNAYRDFMDQLNPGLYSQGDYFWVKNFADKNIAFWGLNSAWASEGDNDRFNIALGYPQVMAALKKTANIPFRVALMHHPPFNWLKDLEYGKTREALFKNCHLLLHGHTHADNALTFLNPSDACICLGANASYTNYKDGFIGFQFIHAHFSQIGTEVMVWPYKLDNRRNEFVPDRERWQTQEGEPYFVISAKEPSLKGEPMLSLRLIILEDYRQWVRDFHSTLPTEQLARRGEVILISLPQVYFPLETTNPFYKTKEEKEDKREINEVEVDNGSDEPVTIDIEELLGRLNCLLLRGKAGMGKTTLIKHLAYSLTHGTGPVALRDYLPVMVFLKDLWPVYKKKIQDRMGEVTFETLLEDYFKNILCPLTLSTIQAYLSENRALMMLDGLDPRCLNY